VFVGVDVSGSFYKAGHYEKRWTFLAYYLYGHLRGLGELQPIRLCSWAHRRELGGGDEVLPSDPGFSGQDGEQIVSDLKVWYPKARVTDLNVFFKEVANIAQKGTCLEPHHGHPLDDGIPDCAGPAAETTGRVER